MPTIKDFTGVVLGTSETSIVSVPAGFQYDNTIIHIVNTDTVSRTVTLDYKIQGTASVARTRLMSGTSLLPGQVVEISGRVLLSGSILTGFSNSANVIAVNVQAVEVRL